MIIVFLFQVLARFLEVFTIIFPQVSTLPFGIDDALSTLFSTWNAILEVMWPLQQPYYCLLAYYGFLIILLLVRFLFGHRVRL